MPRAFLSVLPSMTLTKGPGPCWASLCLHMHSLKVGISRDPQSVMFWTLIPWTGRSSFEMGKDHEKVLNVPHMTSCPVAPQKCGQAGCEGRVSTKETAARRGLAGDVCIPWNSASGVESLSSSRTTETGHWTQVMLWGE